MIPTDTTAVPVVYMNASSGFSSHVSWILQRALGSECKVDSLFEQHADRQVLRECARHGWGESEVFIGRCTARGFTDILGVGLNGKRSVMLAMAIAVVFHVDPRRFEHLYEELREHSIMSTFDCIMESAWQGIRALRRERRMQTQPRQEGAEGEEDCGQDRRQEGHKIVVDFICDGAVPAVSLEPSSVFIRSASWLLQTMTKTEGRAADIYHFVNDERIRVECQHLGLFTPDVWVVRLYPYPFSTAVGMTGQRSAVMALVVAMLLARSVDWPEVLRKVRKHDPFLEGPLRWLDRVVHAKARTAAAAPAQHSRREEEDDQHTRLREAPGARRGYESGDAGRHNSWAGVPSSPGGGQRPASGGTIRRPWRGASSSRSPSRRPARPKKRLCLETGRRDVDREGAARPGDLDGHRDVYVW